MLSTREIKDLALADSVVTSEALQHGRIDEVKDAKPRTTDVVKELAEQQPQKAVAKATPIHTKVAIIKDGKVVLEDSDLSEFTRR